MAASAQLANSTSAHINKRTTSTTTQQPPSLRAPRLLRTPRPTTVMTHPTTRAPPTAKTATARTATTKTLALSTTRQPIQTRTGSRLPRDSKENIAAAPTSAWLARTADRRSTSTNLRQNRSYLSAAAAQNSQTSNVDAVATSAGRSAAASKTHKQIDNSQIKRVTQNNDNNSNTDKNYRYNNSNQQNTTIKAARTSATVKAARMSAMPPSTASLSPSVTSAMAATANTHRHDGVSRQSSSIVSAPNDAVTNQHNQPLLQRQSKQIATFAVQSNVQRATPTQQQTNINDGSGGDAGTANSTRLPQTPKT